MRRIVTGHSEQGNSIVVNDSYVKAINIAPGKNFFQLWGSDTFKKQPNSGVMEENLDWFPQKGGYRFFMWTLPPKSTSNGVPKSKEEIEQLMPGFLNHFESDNPGMHTTDSIDCTYLVSGYVSLELDDNEEVEIFEGDSVIQNGTRHRWHNKGLFSALLVTTCIGSG